MKHNKGFTLIELIVSISLILLLFTIVVPSSVKLVQNSNKKHCQSVVDELLTAADLYAIDKNIKEEKPIKLIDLYNEGYIEESYDLKNGYILGLGQMADDNVNKIVITRTYDETDEEGKRGYNTFSITVNGQTGKDNICK